MFNSRIIDNSSKCNIIKSSLADDLLDYNIVEDPTFTTLIFKSETASSSLNSNIYSNLYSGLNKLVSLANLNSAEVWQPLIIDHDNFVNNKILSDYGSYKNSNKNFKSGRIGIEDFFVFTPYFKHWTVDRAVMSIDWILNKPNCPYYVNYGIMCWYRMKDNTNSRSYGGAAKSIDQFPNGSRLKHSSKPNNVYIKIDNNLLYDITKISASLSVPGAWTFNDESQTTRVEVSSFGDNAQFQLSDIYFERNTADATAEPTKYKVINPLLGSNTHLWIPDGDFFSYFYSEEDKQLSLPAAIPSNSYISSSLYNNYSNIYRIITIDEVRSFDKKDLRKARAYKKLAHALSTSPFVGDFSVYALDYIEIRKRIQQYINDQNTSKSILTEMSLLKNVLVDISRILQDTIQTNNPGNTTNRGLFLDTKQSFNSLSNNLITNHTQLFKKLINKYGANLLINDVTTITPKNLKYNNDGIVISQALDSYVDKNTINDTVYNSQSILFDTVTVSSDTSNHNNQLLIRNSLGSTEVPLVDSAKPLYGQQSNINIQLDYGGDVDSEYRSNGIYFNPIGSLQTYIFEANLTNTAGAGIPIKLSSLNIVPNIRVPFEVVQFDNTAFLESNIIIEWEQISGPPGTFEEINGIRGLAPFTTFYATSSGKYVVQCTASTPFGTYKKRKTFYVVDGRQVFQTISGPTTNTKYGKYLDPNAIQPDTWIYPPSSNGLEETPIFLNDDNLITRTTKINGIAINNIVGVVSPIKTNLSIKQDCGPLGKTRSHNIFELSSDYRFKYQSTYTNRTNQPKLALVFIPNNTIIKINAIYLQKIRTDEPGCENCLSLYESKLISRNDIFYTAGVEGDANIVNSISRFDRINKAPEGFTLVKYKIDPATNSMIFDNYIPFFYPQISTKYAPPIKSYGGYSTNFVKSIIKEPIPEHPFPNDMVVSGIVSNNSPILPSVSGFKIDYRNDKNPDLLKICYQKPLISVPPTGSILKFEKGVFHPSSGWIPYSGAGYQIHANRCGLLKFNPGARDSFSFIGPSLSKMKNDDIDVFNNTINNKVFSSSISLSIADQVRWDPDCSCGKTENGVDPDAGNIGKERSNDNQKHKEYIDTDPHISSHGYRILAGGMPKQSERTARRNNSFVNDEFLTDHNKDSNEISYGFAVTGPSLVPTVVGTDGSIALRNPRVNDFGITDIEVKLNFLNYVNPKNLVVWLEVNYADDEIKKRYPKEAKKPSSPLRASKEFLDQSFDANFCSVSGSKVSLSSLSSINNTILQNYLSCLTDMNSNPTSQSLKLYLLNQENIEHNKFNFSIKFSDSASKYNTLYDTNILPSPTGALNTTPPNKPLAPPILNYMLSSGVSFIKNNENTTQSAIYQNIIHNKDMVLPTISTTGYSDRECCINGSIIKHNKINITNNTLSKFVAKSLFRGRIPESGPCPEQAPMQRGPDLNGKTTFTLKMMILDETDDMNICDNISYQYKNGLDTTDNNLTSPNVFNSLCNWELILHVGPTHQPVPYTNPDITSYGNSDVLSLIDYNKDPTYAGYSFIANLSGYKHLLPIANFNAPYSCVADSTTCISDSKLVVGGGSQSFIPRFKRQDFDFPNYAAMQIIAGLGMNVTGFSVILNFLSELRFFQKLENLGQQIYAPVYDEYVFGSPEKILLLFKKQNSLWYNAEATIMKYHNTPILKPNRYKFIKAQRGNGKHISEFKYKIINDFNDLIDNNNIKSLDCACGDWDTLKTNVPPIEYSGMLVQAGDMVDLNLVPSTGAGCSGQNGLYVIPPFTGQSDYNWIKITESNLDNLSQTIHFSTQNSILCGGKPFFDSSMSSALSGDKIIMTPTRIPYDLFAINDTIECYTQNDTTPSTNISVLNKALIFKDNQYFSVLSLNQSAASGNVISPASGDNIFFIFDNRTSIEDKITKQYNIWGLDQNKHMVGSDIPQIQTNTHSVGSHGDLSLFLQKNLLSNNIRHNHLETYHTIFNNRINDKIKYNQIKVFDKDNVAQTGFKSQSCYGFAYSETDLKANIFDTKNLSTYITPEYFRPDGDTSELFADLDHELKLSSSTENEISYRYGYIKAKVGNQDSALPTGVLYGELTIENDFIEHIPMRMLSDTEIVQLQTRLLLIDDNKFTGVDNSIGSPEETTTVLQSNNLKSILKHYQSLPDDPSHCYRPNDKKSNLCYKKQTEQKINDLYLERKEIIDLLDYQTIRMISLSYTDDNNATQTIDGEILFENKQYLTIKPLTSMSSIKIKYNDILADPPPVRSFKSRRLLPTTHPKWISDSVLPKISPTITVDSTTSAIIISYDIVNADHYWINIDPKQSTFKDFEKNPKILVKTEYFCSPANPVKNPAAIIKNNVCPNLFGSEQPQGSSLDTTLKQDNNLYVYEVKPEIIEQQKADLKQKFNPAILDWTTFTKVRYFNINGDETLDTIPSNETIVKSQEQYLVPITKEDQNSPVLDNGGDGSADTQIVLGGIAPCPGGTNLGSVGGKGLLAPYGRISKPTRVCNIINLDNIDNIDVMIKRIPRLLRGVDLLATVYRYGFKNLYRQVNPTNPLTPTEIDLATPNGTINNSLYYWTCLQKNPDSGLLEQAILPDFFKLQNEMMFRAFFGSVDKIENKTDKIQSLFPWELIPYEYDK